ncbi:MAG TPA: biotin/lipoyl-containing protein, partial [Chryseolinea sp.]|nr:biotin/lipoyl-containing protein [Chryseolinea sp.]
MAQVELIMPKMGESITEATVLSWLKKPGDKIEQEESVLEVATDKVDTEIPSTHAGILKEILVQKGEIVQVGKPIAILTVEAEESAKNETPLPAASPGADGASAVNPLVKDIPLPHTNGKNHTATDYKSSSKFFSPLVKNIAKEE